MIFLFPRWDMLIPWRVCMFITPSILMSSYIPQLVEASFRGRKAGSEVPPFVHMRQLAFETSDSWWGDDDMKVDFLRDYLMGFCRWIRWNMFETSMELLTD